jgi:hypothetical protein
VRGARARDAASIIHRRVVVVIVVVVDVISRDDASIRAASERIFARHGAPWFIASTRAPSRGACARIRTDPIGRRG